jgi:hypothetical protein
MGDLFSFWPQDKRWTFSVLVKNVAGVAFWRAMGYTDYDLTLEINAARTRTSNVHTQRRANRLHEVDAQRC